MHRLTARVSLVLLLLSVIAPVALAASTPPQHACCTRKCCAGKPPHTHPSADPSFDSPPCCRPDYCRSITVSMWAELPLPVSAGAACPSSLLPPDSQLLPRGKERDASHSVRGPPQFSVA